MSSTTLKSKAHAGCAPKGNGDFSRPVSVESVLKTNIKTPCKAKQTPKPRRNGFRNKISPVKQIKKSSSCQNLSESKTGEDNTRCEKSKSFENITTIHARQKIYTRVTTDKKMSDREESLQTDVVQNKVIKEACTAFLLNAWRHRRQENVEIKKQITTLENQTTELRVQIMSLWQLLESEKNRLASANYKAMHHHLLAEEAMNSNRSLHTMNTNLEKDISDLKRQISTLETKCNNQKNELILAKEEIFSLHTQMDKERTKVTKLRDDKKVLLEKAQAAEAEAKRKEGMLIQFENEQKAREDDRHKLQEQIQETNLMIESLLAEKNRQERELEKMKINDDHLKKKMSEMENSLLEKDNEISALKKSCNGYMVETVQLKLGQLKPLETDDESWALYIGHQLTATLICIILPLVKAAAFP